MAGSGVQQLKQTSPQHFIFNSAQELWQLIAVPELSHVQLFVTASDSYGYYSTNIIESSAYFDEKDA